jgi:endonuclease/exonuclease/phosphatase family metal-dependent hydrolase
MPTFSLLTLNCFGVPTPSTRRRLLALAREINERQLTVVCLQEVQTHAYRRLLIRSSTAYVANAFIPFMHAPKGGLLTLTSLPIEQTSFTLYRERGQWYTFAVADWILHKGVLATHMMFHGQPVVVFNTHLTANYTGDWSRRNRYARHEQSQLQQLAELVNTQPQETLVVVAGDFNIPRGGWLYKEFIAATDLFDAMAYDKRATFRPPRGVPARYKTALDYVLVRAPRLPGLEIESNLCFEEKVQLSSRRQGYLSDHFGIQIEIRWEEES